MIYHTLSQLKNTALVAACHTGNKELVKLLIERKADLNITSLVSSNGYFIIRAIFYIELYDFFSVDSQPS